MNPGDNNRQIVLQTLTQSQNPDTGEPIIDWESGALTLWAEWMPGNSREAYFAQNRLGAHVDGVFRVAFISRPNPTTQRILWDGLIYDVHPAVEYGYRQGWEIPVTAKADT